MPPFVAAICTFARADMYMLLKRSPDVDATRRENLKNSPGLNRFIMLLDLFWDTPDVMQRILLYSGEEWVGTHVFEDAREVYTDLVVRAKDVLQWVHPHLG